MQRIESDLQRARQALDSPARLTQQEVLDVLQELATFFRKLPPGDQRGITKTFVQVLETVKLVADDVFLQTFADIRGGTAAVRRAQQAAALVLHLRTVQEWDPSQPAPRRLSAVGLGIRPSRPPSKASADRPRADR